MRTGNVFVTQARYQQVSLKETPYYHCISRCVRRAYLFGEDPVSGYNFDHRKTWLVNRIKELTGQFAIDVCAYAVMNDHYHLVLYVNQEKADKWADVEVIGRWSQIFPRNKVIVETLQKNLKHRAAGKKLREKASLWRERLSDISWFMRCLNEYIARQANIEEGCKGRFWEGRFKSQALLDEKSLVTCMAYVDLNPIRAGVSGSLEHSDFTSIQERLMIHAKKVKSRNPRQNKLLTRRNAKHLMPSQASKKRFLLKPLINMDGVGLGMPSLSQKKYFHLLENTARVLTLTKQDTKKSRNLLGGKNSLLEIMGITPEAWLKSIKHFHRYYGRAAGDEIALIKFHKSRIKAGVDLKYSDKWVRGKNSARLLYGT